MSSSDQLGFAFRAPERRTWTVRELVAAVRTSIERDYGDAWVEGEISNFRAHDSGHLYFTLKDQNAQLSAVMFRSQARLLRFRPENGMQVVARGRVTIYEDRGQLQISVEHLEPRGAGALQIAFEQLKGKLAAEGLFDAERKKPLPALPARIGIVTSPQAAALRDILQILRRRHDAANVLIYPAQVQGEMAAAEVIAGLRHFNSTNSVDVIIVARGGGSAEDLAAFNHEGLARAASASAIPIISAVGHETDFTILDFVADLRAPTPSAAAELVIRSRQEIDEQAFALKRRLEKAVRYELLMARQKMVELTRHGAFARMMELIGRRQQRIDDLGYRLAGAQRRILESKQRRFASQSAAVRHFDVRRVLGGVNKELSAQVSAMAAAVRSGLLRRRGRLNQLEGQVKALSPLAILDRGYALVFDASGTLIRDAAGVKDRARITARLASGTLKATVNK